MSKPLGKNKRRPQQVIFAADDARVIRTSELRRLCELAGDQRTLAAALGVSVSTVCRALQGATPEERRSKAERAAAVIAALGEQDA